jgi:hypothetical protein
MDIGRIGKRERKRVSGEKSPEKRAGMTRDKRRESAMQVSPQKVPVSNVSPP